MDSIQEYIDKTKSAVQKTYQAINSYREPLLETNMPTFSYWGEYTDETHRKHEQWSQKNSQAIKEHLNKQNNFAYEIFAMSTLSGTILHYAYQAIEMFSTNTSSYLGFKDVIPENNNNAKAPKFCIGREIDGIPLGLIVYAGRNQAQHFNDEKYNGATTRVFHYLANWYSPRFKKNFVDSYFDLSNENVDSYASNILWKLDWQHYSNYERDLLLLLE